MELHRIRLENFRQHRETELEFGTGITSIIGPNGSGKTTILEAMVWAFYGMDGARGGKVNLRWNGAPARAKLSVEVDFSLNGHDYRVVRYLNKAELFQDGGAAPIADSTTSVTERIQRLLGMDVGEFFNTHFTRQKELAIMASMGAVERGKFLSRVLGYEKLRTVQDRLAKTRSTLNGGINALGHGLGEHESLEQEYSETELRVQSSRETLIGVEKQLVGAKKELEVVGPLWTRAVEAREQLQGMVSNRLLAEQKVSQARKEFERIDRELALALAARNEFTVLEPELARVEPLKIELAALEEDSKRAGLKRTLQGQLEEVDQEIERFTSRLEELETSEAELKIAREELDRAHKALHDAQAVEEEQRTAWVRDKQDAETKRESLAGQYRDIAQHQKGLVGLGPDGSCPMCNRALGQEFKSVIESLKFQLEEIEINGKFFKQRVAQLEDEPGEYLAVAEQLKDATLAAEEAAQKVARCEAQQTERLEREREKEGRTKHRDELRGQVASLPDSYDAERHDAVRKELDVLEPIVKTGIELRHTAQQAKNLVAEAELAEKVLSERELEVKGLTERIEDLGFDESEYSRAREQNEASVEAVRRLELEHVSSQADVKTAEVALNAVVTRLEERARRAESLKELQNELKLNEALNVALKNLRDELNASMRPEISEVASSFLADLTDGRYQELELDEKYQTLIVEDGVTKPVISGGEEDVVNLVLRIAISQMVAERSGHPLSLLVLDEVFGSLDEARRQNVINLLMRLGDRFPQVVLISHIESVKNGADRVVRVSVEEKTGASCLEDEISGDHVAA
jgi:exonuclease SbcC